MKKSILLLFTCALAASLACNKKDDQPIPGPTPAADLELHETSDFNFADYGMARVEDLDPNDLSSDNPTHVNYGVAMVNTVLQEVEYGEKTFFQLDPNDQSEVLVGVVFNLYSLIEAQGGTAADNLIGSGAERTFAFAQYSATDPKPTGNYFVEGTLAILDKTNEQNIRSFIFTEGTITVSGQAPDFSIEFDVSMLDDVRNIEGAFTGTATGSFQIIENR